MNGDRERKDPLPLSRTGSEPELPPEQDHREPRLRASRDEPEVARESGLAAPSDLRAAHQSRNSLPVMTIAAFVLFCLIGAAYAYLKFSDAEGPPPVAEIRPPAAVPAGKTAATPETPVTPAPATAPPATAARQPASPMPVAKAPPPAAAPVVDEAAMERARARLHAEEAARRAAEQDRLKRAQAEKAAKAEQAKRAEEQARIKREQAEKAAKAEQARLAAIRQREEKMRAERQRKERAARRAAEARSKEEQALQSQLDQAAASPPPPAPVPSSDEAQPQPQPRRQNAKLVPRSRSDDDGPPLDAGDLPPRTPGDVAPRSIDDENQ